MTAVQLQSNAARNAALGGMVGLLTQAREGDNMANCFVINLTRGGTVQVVTEQRNIRIAITAQSDRQLT